mmetsp:Transcript_27540/g.38916  ORF Transcript_27540/g.38916 Transcript_27540/m.38916 type:complete len:377 (-) Transcript_27540:239-1369(-)|eukprot:CAMPEP_0175104016 /NCGR_PEP_ID=MMETSP0086_2-20121207/9453_1 /TAXON_ID=136419 /ORGANISM="Unknown Unknown, Strain D1" /LENGTH=376 /DNA_ID=CAMNT_0016379281 /DNA_START=28 /DNA_END=1158 /DNA_ORIENTATION=-
MSETKESVEDLSNDAVVTKYRLAGDLVNNAFAKVQALCKAGARIVEICDVGDNYILEECSKIFKGKKVEKGIAFPTSISVNNIVGHFSPSAADKSTLKAGDIAKIDLGVQIDGYVSTAAHTVVIGEDGLSTKEITGKVADVAHAAYTAAELAIRMLKPGNNNAAITDMLAKVSAAFNCNVVQGVLSHEMDRGVIDGEKVIISKSDADHKVNDFEFEPNSVFAVDIVMSSGDGKPKEHDQRERTVFKRDADATYQLKVKASRALLSDVDKNYGTFPFSTRALDQKNVLLGIRECVDHGLLHPYPVLYEKEGEVVVQIKFTALLMASGTVKSGGLPFDVSQFKTECKLEDEELLKVLATSVGKKKKKNNKKKKKPAAE